MGVASSTKDTSSSSIDGIKERDLRKASFIPPLVSTGGRLRSSSPQLFYTYISFATSFSRISLMYNLLSVLIHCFFLRTTLLKTHILLFSLVGQRYNLTSRIPSTDWALVESIIRSIWKCPFQSSLLLLNEFRVFDMSNHPMPLLVDDLNLQRQQLL
nr:hypothetical protein ZC513.7 - Caenorhabditis elegans [Caenorhabditis elegans]